MKSHFIIFLYFIQLFTNKASGQNSNPDTYLKHFINCDYDSAEAFLKERILREPKNSDLYYYLGKTYSAMDNPSHAVIEFKKSLKFQPDNIKIYEALGKAYEEQGMFGDAIDIYKKITQIDRSQTPAWLKIAVLSFKQQDYKSAISVLHPLTMSDSTQVMIYDLLGRSHLKIGEYESAIQVLGKAVQLDSTRFTSVLNLGIAYYYSNRIHESVHYLKKAIKISPKSDGSYYYMGVAYAEMNNINEAVQYLEKASSLKGPYKIKSMKALLENYYNRNDFEDCIRVADHFFSLDTDCNPSVFHHYKARALSDLNETVKAKEEFEKALESTELRYIMINYFYQAFNAYRCHRYADAIKLYQKAISLNPDYSYAYYNLAITYDDYYSDKRTAIDYYQKFLTLTKDSNNPVDLEMSRKAKKRIGQLKEKQFLKNGSK